MRTKAFFIAALLAMFSLTSRYNRIKVTVDGEQLPGSQFHLKILPGRMDPPQGPYPRKPRALVQCPGRPVWMGSY